MLNCTKCTICSKQTLSATFWQYSLTKIVLYRNSVFQIILFKNWICTQIFSLMIKNMIEKATKSISTSVKLIRNNYNAWRIVNEALISVKTRDSVRTRLVQQSKAAGLRIARVNSETVENRFTRSTRSHGRSARDNRGCARNRNRRRKNTPDGARIISENDFLRSAVPCARAFTRVAELRDLTWAATLFCSTTREIRAFGNPDLSGLFRVWTPGNWFAETQSTRGLADL